MFSVNFRAGPCQEYIDEFCDKICQAVKEDILDNELHDRCMTVQRLLQAIQTEHRSGEGEKKRFNDTLFCHENKLFHPRDEFEDVKSIDQGMEFYDDVYGGGGGFLTKI